MTDLHPTAKVAALLSEIVAMYDELREAAIHSASAKVDGTSLPGGAAMVALGPVANLEAWEHMTEASERLARAYTSAEDEDPDDAWSAFQLLEFWSEAWRRETGAEYGQRPTITSEANFIRWSLDWAWDNEPGWDDFANDVRTAHLRLEDILKAGHRTEVGVPCLACSTDLIRPTHRRREHDRCNGHDGVCYLPHDRCPHDRGGLRDEWVCPNEDCGRVYDMESYARATSHAAFIVAEWLPLDQVMARTGAPRGSIQGWATRGKVQKRRDVSTGRVLYRVADVLAIVAGTESAAC